MNRVIQRNAMASPLSEFLGVLVVLVVLWYGGSLVLKGDAALSPQEFMGYIGLFYTIINPVKFLTTVNYNLKKGRPALDRNSRRSGDPFPLRLVNAIDPTNAGMLVMNTPARNNTKYVANHSSNAAGPAR